MALIKDVVQSTEDSLFGFQELSLAAQKKLLEIVLDKLYKLSSKKGVLSFGGGSSDEINQIIKEVYKEFGFEKYRSDVRELFRTFDDIGQSTVNLSSNFAEVDKINFSEQKKFIINELSERLASPESFKANIVGDVRRILAKRILLQSSIKDLKEELSQSLKGNNGTLAKYVTQITTDAVYQYQGSINQAIQKEFGLDGYKYINSIIDTSRPQCVRWVKEKNGLLLLKPNDSIDTYGILSKEIEWAKKYGSGYGKPGKSYYLELNIDNFAIVRGGYNCRHRALPFRVTPKDLQRTERFRKELNKEIEKYEKNIAA